MSANEVATDLILSSGIDALAAIVNASRDAIWSWRADGTIISWNAEAERLFGYSGDEIVGQSILVLVPDERRERAKAAMSSLGRGDWIGQYETERVRKDGSRIPVELTVSPIRDASGGAIGAATICRDITERKEAEKARQWLALIVDSSDDAIVAKSLEGIIASWNPGAERLFGYSADEVVGQPITVIIPADRLHEDTHILDRIRRGERVEPFDTVRRRKDGSLIDVSLTVSPVKDASGNIIGASKVARDISDRKRAEHLRDLLVHELNHRVKNILAIVQAMANQTFRDSRDTQEALRVFQGRLGALAAAHDLLVREDWEDVPLESLIRNVLEALGQGGRIEISGPSFVVGSRTATTLAIALHELCTNAMKYGSLSTPEGTVSLEWDFSDQAGGAMILSWQERGGPPISRPTHRGFGMLMLESALSQELGSDVALNFGRSGLICTMPIPLPRR